MPLAEYGDFAAAIARVRHGDAYALACEPPELLEPTSGSTAEPKLIPVNRTLRREFAAAIDPWIAWLYTAHPAILFGRHYWAVSPNTPAGGGTDRAEEEVPVGFSDDADYLGMVGRFVSRRILVNPGDLRHVTQPEDFCLLTLLFLMADRNLRLISVWHPSFLTLLLEAMPRHLPAILAALLTGELPPTQAVPEHVRAKLARRFRRDRRRAEEIGALALSDNPRNTALVWPRLSLISCWGGTRSEPWLSQLKAIFPDTSFQLKGLLATEGCVSVPTGCGRKHPCAVTSHYLEFVDAGTGAVQPVWDLALGATYTVVLTTGGGFWRYRLHDLVRVADFCGATPCLEFLGKSNAVSDLVGEKLAEPHVEEALQAAEAALGMSPVFCMVVPLNAEAGQHPGYLLLIELAASAADDMARVDRLVELVEAAFCRNYHYAHARRLGQLQPLRAAPVRKGLERYRAAREAAGGRIGTIKVPALELGRALTKGWWRLPAQGALSA